MAGPSQAPRVLALTSLRSKVNSWRAIADRRLHCEELEQAERKMASSTKSPRPALLQLYQTHKCPGNLAKMQILLQWDWVS